MSAVLRSFAVTAVCLIGGHCSTASSAPIYFSQVINVYFGAVTAGTSSTNIVEIEGGDGTAAGTLPLTPGVAESLGENLAAQLLDTPLQNDCITPICPPDLTPIPPFVLTAISSAPSPYILGLDAVSGAPNPALEAFNNALAQNGLPGNATFTPFDDELAFTYQVNDTTDQIYMLGNFELYQLSATPLPSSGGIMLIGLIVVGVLAFRRRYVWHPDAPAHSILRLRLGCRSHD